MSTLIGILADVSGSMRNNVGDGVDEEVGSWARSIFKVVDELIKHDVPSSNNTFALAFGSPSEPRVFDLLSTVKEVQGKVNEEKSCIEDLRSNISKRYLIEEALAILESNGAKRVRKWAKMDVLLKVVDDTAAAGILYYLQKNSDFTKRFVYECLPRECRELTVNSEISFDNAKHAATESAFFLFEFVGTYVSPVGSKMQEWGTVDSVRKAIDKGKRLVTETMTAAVKKDVKMVGVSKAAIMSVHNASEVLHASVGDQELTKEQVDESLKAVEPYIYGGNTPLMQAMRDSVELFSYAEFANHQKLLFVLSDGQPTDGNDPPLQRLSDLGVTIVSCFITSQKLSDPRRLYSVLDETWEEPAKFMFRISSTITTQKIPRTLFVKKGWTIDIDNNETRLFVQVNHPDIIKDVCHLAKNAVLSQDALSDALSSVDLDIYINKANEGFGAKTQYGGTCYANATAAVLHLAMKRIVRRDGGYPDFFELRRELIDKHGKDKARTMEVLEKICPKYRLQCQKVDAVGAMKAVSAKRPVVARFSLTEAQWDQFRQFYKKNPKGILTRAYLNSTQQHSTSDRFGHAVVLTSYDAESLRLIKRTSRGQRGSLRALAGICEFH